MGKLGKKARKFAKKNLQSVLKRRRKIKSMIKRKASKREGRGHPEDEERDTREQPKERNFEDQDILDIPLEDVFGRDGIDEDEDDSDSDGYLSEESDGCAEGDQNGTCLEDNKSMTALSAQSNDIYSELAKKKSRLEKLKRKDPEFSKFLDNYEKSLDQFRDDEVYSGDDTSNDGMEEVEEDTSKPRKIKLLTMPTIDAWCQQVIEKQSVPALTSLLNAYQAASHCRTESSHFSRVASIYEIPNGECFARILFFMLREGNKIFRGLLGIPCSSCKKETILDLRSTQKWKNLKPLIKSFLRSTLFILGEITDSGILDFALKQLRDAIIFFAAFPSLLHRLMKVSIHLWATGKGSLSSQSFLIIRVVASTFGSDWFDTCLIKMYKTFIAHSKFIEPGLRKHMEYLRNSIVELCSLDVHKSSGKALVSIKHLAKILQLALRTKKKEALKKVFSWQYTNCVHLWVTFTSENSSDYDLQALLFIIVQIINGMAGLFLGPRYLPLRIKCIQWLNTLSHSSGIFIPVASFALDILEYRVGKVGGKRAKDFKFLSSVKLPKYWLKSQDFQEQCVFSSIELLCVHFDQWCHHISFPELATAPLIRLRKFCGTTTAETFNRSVKRFIDQVEQNIDFVRKKRDEVAFSPKDDQAVETFLQLERSNANISYRQYYRNVIQKAVSHGLLMNESSMEKKKLPKERRQLQNRTDVAIMDGELENGDGGKVGKKRKT
ncbi:nucleolar complex protein 2 homolog isoform X2 [Punica granatum]|uniref:Nucleolar complex protein 2 homolog isoform X2 n=1 Tax=Punica granatum TaxID=22663 RepID=A0A6P8CLX8_PUNGR|nr:nucleolar complex protein 2 homolog isoform X2 [Punica granatum]